MPLYDFRCEKCDVEVEGYASVASRNEVACPMCGDTMTVLITTRARSVVYDYFSENLDAYVTGPAQRRRLMKERGLEEAG